LDKTERDLKRVQGLYRDSSATLELLENATTGRDVAADGYRIAVFNQQYAEIRANRSGKIVKKLLNEGEITGPGNPVLVLYEAGKDDWVVDVNLPDRDWARLQMGATAEVHMDAYPEKVFSGRVSRLAPAADPTNGLYEVEISVQPQGLRFAPGLFAEVDFDPRDAASYPVIPIEALIEGDGYSAFVFVPDAQAGTVRKAPITVAFIDNNNVFVNKGLEGVTQVVTSGAPYLNETKKIRVIQ
jgi:RND family efflux transporter MFP subunit